MAVTDEIATAAGQLGSGDASRAYDTITAVLECPARIAATELPGALEVLARTTADLFGDPWGTILGRAAAEARSADALGAAGSFLVEQGFAALAVTLLDHAARLDPGDGALLCERVTAHEQLGDHLGAVRVIDAADHRAREGFLPRYLLAFNALMAFDPERTRLLAPSLRQSASDDAQHFMAARIEGMLSRLDALADAGFARPPRHDLQAWHLIRSGGLLLGGGAGDPAPDGRGSRVEDSAASCRTAIDRVRAVLAALHLTPTAVLFVPNDSSLVLANTTARVLDLPSHELPEHTAAPGLVVVYDIERMEGPVLDALARHEAGQILWSHALRWTIDHGVTPDIATFMHQQVVRPWEEALDGEGLTGAAAGGWVERILHAQPEEIGDRDARLVRLAEATRGCGEHAAGVFRASGRRQKLFAVPMVPEPR